MILVDRFLDWLADRLAERIAVQLQIGAHCGLCGKWVPDEVTWKPWAWTLCDNCREGKKDE